MANKMDLPGDVTGAGLESVPDLVNEFPPDLCQVLSAISRAVVDIGVSIRNASNGFESKECGTQNTFGDKQLEVDVSTDKAVFERLRATKLCTVGSSEETTEEVNLGGTKYAVAFDPLDGSSIVDANFTVGSIFGVWEAKSFLGKTPGEQKAACMAMYGPRITMALAYEGPGGKHAIELTYTSCGWAKTKDFHIAAAGKIFAPGNLRAGCDNPKYQKLVDHWVQNGYTLRYTGGMVPDVYHILFKGKGVFANCASEKAKAKLRLLYEVGPIAYIIEAAGGKSMIDPFKTGQRISVMDMPVRELDQRVGVCYGGADEVKLFESYMFKGEEAESMGGA